MSTPSIVAIRTKNEYMGIYVHYDGESEYMKNNLKKHFNTPKKARQLIELGDMSGIEGNYAECQLESYYYKALNCPGYEHMQKELEQNENCFDAKSFKNLNDLHNYAKDRGCRLYIFENNVWVKEDKEGFLLAI